MTNFDQYRAGPRSDGAVDETETQLGWLLTAFARETPAVAHVVAVSADGLALAVSEHLPTERADQLGAITCGLASLTDGAARCLGTGPVSHTVVDMRGGILLVLAIDENAHLAVLVSSGGDLGQIGYESALLARRVGSALSPSSRIG